MSLGTASFCDEIPPKKTPSDCTNFKTLGPYAKSAVNSAQEFLQEFYKIAMDWGYRLDVVFTLWWEGFLYWLFFQVP